MRLTYQVYARPYGSDGGLTRMGGDVEIRGNDHLGTGGVRRLARHSQPTNTRTAVFYCLA